MTYKVYIYIYIYIYIYVCIYIYIYIYIAYIIHIIHIIYILYILHYYYIIYIIYNISCTQFLKCIRIQQVYVSSLHLKSALQNKFLNLFPMSLSLYTPNLKIFKKMPHSYQIITSFGSDEIPTPSFNH